MIEREMILKQLREVVEAVKEAKGTGIYCLLPDVVVFEDEGVYFEVPLQDEMEAAVALLEREALKATYSYPHKGN